MGKYEEIKEQVTSRDAAEYYGLEVTRNGMVCCPFHDDRHPSMKVDKNFYCFGCQEKGDVIRFVEKLFALSSQDAADKIISDFGLSISLRQGAKQKYKTIRAKKRISEKKQFEMSVDRAFWVYCSYFHLLNGWAEEYAPKSPEDDYNPLFVEAMHKRDYVDYLLDILLYGTTEEKADLLIDKAREVITIEQRIREFESCQEKCTSRN